MDPQVQASLHLNVSKVKSQVNTSPVMGVHDERVEKMGDLQVQEYTHEMDD